VTEPLAQRVEVAFRSGLPLSSDASMSKDAAVGLAAALEGLEGGHGEKTA